MHEFSLAQGLHTQLLDLARQHNCSKILFAEVAIGKNAGIVVESFSFGVNVMISQSEITKDMKCDIIENDGDDLVLQRVELE